MLKETMCMQKKRKSTLFRLLFPHFFHFMTTFDSRRAILSCLRLTALSFLIYCSVFFRKQSCLDMLVFKAFTNKIAFVFCNIIHVQLDYVLFSFSVPKCCTFFCISFIACIFLYSFLRYLLYNLLQIFKIQT